MKNLIESLFIDACAAKAIASIDYDRAVEAVNYAESVGVTIAEGEIVNCGFGYEVWEFYAFGRTPSGSHRRYGAIQDKPGSSLWRVHGKAQTFTLADMVIHLTNAIVNESSL